MFEARRTAAGTVTFPVRVSPRARKSSIAGVVAGALHVRVAAPPAEDRANEALRELLAERLNIPRTAVKIVRGRRGRLKQVEVPGSALDAVLGLSSALPP